MTTRGDRVASVLLLVSGLAYSSWVLAGWLNPPLHSIDSYASELAATDQPLSWLFRSGDAIAGAAALAAGLLVVRHRPRLGWACVTVFGLCTLADVALFPMECAPSIDPTCAAAELAGELSARHYIHTVTSGLAGLAPLLGLVVTAWVWRTVAAWALCGLMLAATTATLVAVASQRLIGVGQRWQLVVVASWLVWLAVRLWRGRTEEPRR